MYAALASDGRYETCNGQLMFPSGFEACIPKDDMVRFFVRELDRLDYTNLYAAGNGSLYHSGPGRPQTDPRLLFRICAFAYANDIYSSRKIEEACKKRIDFMWLLDGQPAPSYVTIANFRSGACKEAIEDLFYQHVRHLEGIGVTDHEVGIIDGTKMESFANRYTFVWRKTVERYLAKTTEKAGAALCHLGHEGDASVERLRSAAGGIREQMAAQGIEPVSGRGHCKSPEQRDLEELEAILEKWQRYEGQLAIMGPERNSYSKTDTDATFLRMKDDHMRNGQLKPGYNVQICVNSEFVTGIGVFADRNDVGTLEPFMDDLFERHGIRYKAVSADAGYESLANYRYLGGIGIDSFIKPTNYEQIRTRKFKQQIGRRENMKYDEAGDCYVCAEGRRLSFVREHIFTPKDGMEQTNRVYRCKECRGCVRRKECCKSKDADTPKEIEVNPEFAAYRERSAANITSGYGIRLRINRSIQVEGAFGVIKQDHHFRRFLCGGNEKVLSELHLLGIGYNIRKHYRKTMDGRLDDHLFRVRKAA
jgi:transposase